MAGAEVTRHPQEVVSPLVPPPQLRMLLLHVLHHLPHLSIPMVKQQHAKAALIEFIKDKISRSTPLHLKSPLVPPPQVWALLLHLLHHLPHLSTQDQTTAGESMHAGMRGEQSHFAQQGLCANGVPPELQNTLLHASGVTSLLCAAPHTCSHLMVRPLSEVAVHGQEGHIEEVGLAWILSPHLGGGIRMRVKRYLRGKHKVSVAAGSIKGGCTQTG